MATEKETVAINAVFEFDKQPASEAHKLMVPLPEVPGYIWGWGRYCFDGYRQNYSQRRDLDNLNRLVDAGWMPVVKSPHPDLPLNKAGYVTAGDVVLCVKKIQEALPCEYLEITNLTETPSFPDLLPNLNSLPDK
jgi:hypothetical protein